MNSSFFVELDRFNNETYIEKRLAEIPSSHRGAMRTALKYLYCDEGPINLERNRLKLAKEFLDPTEKIVAQWLSTRTNGSLRKSYGVGALHAAHKSRYCCEHCSYADVRALIIDHVDGRVKDTAFACLCANCHAIKSREKDWLGTARTPIDAVL